MRLALVAGILVISALCVLVSLFYQGFIVASFSQQPERKCQVESPLPSVPVQPPPYSKLNRVTQRWVSGVENQSASQEYNWTYNAHESCRNVGFFYAENWANLFHFRHGIKRICCGDEPVPSVKALVQATIPGVVWGGQGTCDEIYSPIYSCLIPYSCRNNREQLVLTNQEYWEAYDSLMSSCRVPVQYDVIIMNRDGEFNRHIVNVNAIVERLVAKGKKVLVITSSNITKAETQCDIFRLYSSARVSIIPYGSDVTYSLLLNQPNINLMHKQASEGYFDTFRHIMGRFAPFKTLSVNGVLPKPYDPNNNYIMYSSEVYHSSNFNLSLEELDDMMTIYDFMAK